MLTIPRLSNPILPTPLYPLLTLFSPRNYELPAEAGPLAERIRACSGSSRHEVWEAVRASSAAPYCEYEGLAQESRGGGGWMDL